MAIAIFDLARRPFIFRACRLPPQKYQGWFHTAVLRAYRNDYGSGPWWVNASLASSVLLCRGTECSTLAGVRDGPRWSAGIYVSMTAADFDAIELDAGGVPPQRVNAAPLQGDGTFAGRRAFGVAGHLSSSPRGLNRYETRPCGVYRVW